MLGGAFSHNSVEVTIRGGETKSALKIKNLMNYLVLRIVCPQICPPSTPPCVYVPTHTDLSPPESRALMLRVGVQCCTMHSSAASTSCLMKALLSPAFCSKALTVPSSSWSIAFCKWVYRSPSVHIATLDTPDRRFFTWVTWTLLIRHRKQDHPSIKQQEPEADIKVICLTKFDIEIRSEAVRIQIQSEPAKWKQVKMIWECYIQQVIYLLNERQADTMKPAL